MNVTLEYVRFPKLVYEELRHLVDEGFVLSVEDAVVDACRRYAAWARDERGRHLAEAEK